jgi:hypothetical protein
MAEDFMIDGPFGVVGDPSVQESNYKSWDAGDYMMVGIHSFITIDKDRNQPIFKMQGDQLVARFKILILQKDLETQNTLEVEGPAMSATVPQMCMLVRAFGGDPSKLPTEATSMFLNMVQDELHKYGKERKAHLKEAGGWVSWVEGLNPPTKDIFTWLCVGFYTKGNDTPVRFKENSGTGPNGSYTEDIAFAKFRIVSDGWGNPSLYDGYETSIKIYNPFSGEADDKGRPATALGLKGGIPMHVKRFMHLISVCCSADFNTHQWTADLEKSKYGINEIANPLPVVDADIKAAKRLVCAALSENRNGRIQLAIDDLSVYKGKEIDLAKDAAEAAKQPSELELFVRKAEKIAGFPIFKTTPPNSNSITLEFTPEGVEWAKKTLAPVWDKLGLPTENGRRTLGKLTPEQLKQLTLSIETDGIDSF